MKKEKGLKNYLAYLPVLVLGVSIITGYIKLSLSAEDTKTKVKENEDKIKKVEEKGGEEIEDLKEKDSKLEKAVEVNKAQQDNIQREVQKINDKTDKIVDLLLEMKAKNKK